MAPVLQSRADSPRVRRLLRNDQKGFNSFWQEDPFYTRLPAGRPKRSYPPGQFYSTDAFADYALDFLADARRDPGRPWLLYLAFNAPHFPLHAPPQEVDRYASIYEKGWDSIREERLARMKHLGIVGPETPLTPRSDWDHPFHHKEGVNPARNSLPADRCTDLARRMAIFAAMVEHMDGAIGRVVSSLKEHGQLDNTLILFLSDNGACAEWDPLGFDVATGPKTTNVLHTGKDLAAMGGPGTYHSYGSGWANASNTPWRLYSEHFAPRRGHQHFPSSPTGRHGHRAAGRNRFSRRSYRRHQWPRASTSRGAITRWRRLAPRSRQWKAAAFCRHSGASPPPRASCSGSTRAIAPSATGAGSWSRGRTGLGNCMTSR